MSSDFFIRPIFHCIFPCFGNSEFVSLCWTGSRKLLLVTGCNTVAFFLREREFIHSDNNSKVTTPLLALHDPGKTFRAKYNSQASTTQAGGSRVLGNTSYKQCHGIINGWASSSASELGGSGVETDRAEPFGSITPSPPINRRPSGSRADFWSLIGFHLEMRPRKALLWDAISARGRGKHLAFVLCHLVGECCYSLQGPENFTTPGCLLQIVVCEIGG